LGCAVPNRLSLAHMVLLLLLLLPVMVLFIKSSKNTLQAMHA
jgi:hypothetical protein